MEFYILPLKIFENYYGTLKKHVDELIKKNDILFDIDWQGTQQLAEHAGEDLIRVFILPPTTRELERRLKSDERLTLDDDLKLFGSNFFKTIGLE